MHTDVLWSFLCLWAILSFQTEVKKK